MLCPAERYPGLDENCIWAKKVSHPVLLSQEEYGEFNPPIYDIYIGGMNPLSQMHGLLLRWGSHSYFP
jgi:hypothetical protein